MHDVTTWIDPFGLHGQSPSCTSTLQERLDQTPNNNGTWKGRRGEGTFTITGPEDSSVLGQKVQYRNGYPDFRPHTKHTVEIENFVEKAKIKNARYSLHKEADQILAERLGVDPKLIKKFRRVAKFTWHEVEDMRTLQLVPTDINGKFGHLGGISEAKKQ